MTVKTGAAGIESDDFYDSNPGSHWTLSDPQGNGTVTHEGGGTSDAWMVLGRTLDAGIYNQVEADTEIAYLQDASNNDFTIQCKQETEFPLAAGMECGLWIQDSTGDEVVTASRYTEGNDYYVYGGNRTSGSWTYPGDAQWNPTGMPVYLRISRSTNDWDIDYSQNGSSWTDITTISSKTFTVSKVGLYIANYSDNDTAFSVKFDYFMEMDSGEISPEDSAGTSRRVMVIS